MSDMKFDPEKQHRKSIRLPEYDYSGEGAYFVTICTQNRECLFGNIRNGKMELSAIGRVVRDCWKEIPKHFDHARVKDFVVMPNHLHGIVVLEKRVEYIQPLQKQMGNQIVGVQYIEPAFQKGTARYQYQKVAPNSVGSIVRSYKAAVSRICRENLLHSPIWQRNYYEHIVRSGQELYKIREYIRANPLMWKTDPENQTLQTRL
ncbi:MAG TPA: transposase [Verrucomicrobiae bacterium]|nr:transposase [Verrucomicrobiae bacterium]